MGFTPKCTGVGPFSFVRVESLPMVNEEKLPQVWLLTRYGCHLCDDARQVVEQVTSELGLGYTEIDIDDDPQLRQRHDTEVPVVCVNGVPTDFWQISGRRLRKILRAEIANQP